MLICLDCGAALRRAKRTGRKPMFCEPCAKLRHSAAVLRWARANPDKANARHTRYRAKQILLDEAAFRAKKRAYDVKRRKARSKPPQPRWCTTCQVSMPPWLKRGRVPQSCESCLLELRRRRERERAKEYRRQHPELHKDWFKRNRLRFNALHKKWRTKKLVEGLPADVAEMRLLLRDYRSRVRSIAISK